MGASLAASLIGASGSVRRGFQRQFRQRFRSGLPGVTGTSKWLPGLISPQPSHNRFAVAWNGRVLGFQPERAWK